MRNILITGGTGIIGSKLVEAMLKEGNYVAFTTRSKRRGLEKIRLGGYDGKNVKIIEVDFESKDAIDRIKSQIPNKIDTIIHNARTLDSLKVDGKGRVSRDQFGQELHLGVSFPYELTNNVIDWKTGLKDIIFISSMYGVVAPNPSLYVDFSRQSPINYGVIKAAQIHLTKELAVRLAESKIRVNCISYGGVEGRVEEEFKKRYARLNPMGRMLNADDLYPPIKYILSNPNLCVTGENIKVDGGWTIW